MNVDLSPMAVGRGAALLGAALLLASCSAVNSAAENAAAGGSAGALAAGSAAPSKAAAASASASDPAPASASPSASASASPSATSRPTHTATPRPTTVASPASAGCTGAGLAAAVGAQQGGAGHEQLVVTLTNTSSSRCALTGYPALELVGPGNQPLVTTVVRGGASTFPDTTPRTVTLGPGQPASFDVDFTDVASGGSCPAAQLLRITPPSGGGQVSLVAPLAPCDHGTLHVSPVVAGASGV